MTNPLSHAEIAREIRLLHPNEKATSHHVGLVRRGDMASARLSALIAEAIPSLNAKAKAERKARKPRKVAA